MCLGSLAQALCLQMAAKFLPSPSVSAASSNSNVSDPLIPPVTPTSSVSLQVHKQDQDGLPKAFVASLRVLFDILDEDKDGLVPLVEIKERWQSEEGPIGLPHNVIDSLHKVTPKSGKLSFERFCSGLRLALVNNRERSPDYRGPPSARNAKLGRPATTATVRPNIVHPLRTNKSAPQLQNQQDMKKPRLYSEDDAHLKTYVKPNIPVSKPVKKPHRYSTGNYDQVYFTYQQQSGGDRSSLDSYDSYNRDPKSGLKIPITRQRSSNSKTKQEELAPKRKDIPPNPNSHTDYMDYADLYHSPISGKNKDPRNRVSPSQSSSRALSPSARPTSPTRPVSPTVMSRDFGPARSRNSKVDVSIRDHRPTSPTRTVSPTVRDYGPPRSRNSRSEVQRDRRSLSPTGSSRPISPMSPTSKSLGPPSLNQVRPPSRMSDREIKRRSASRERSVRHLKNESPVENGMERHVREHSRERSQERRKSPPVYNTNHNSNHVATRHHDNSPPNSNHVGPSQQGGPRGQHGGPGQHREPQGQHGGPRGQHGGSRGPDSNTPPSSGGRTGLRVSESSAPPRTGLRVSDSSGPPPVKRQQRRPRDESRRHTSNGISTDYNLLKRMKQLEEERDTLIQGLEAVDRAKDWYQRQLTDVKEKQRVVHRGQMIHGENPNSESQQDRLAFQALRIAEVNKQLAALVDSSEKMFPEHINLAMEGRRSIYLPVDTPISAQLRDQNRMLTKEVSNQSNRITKLEQEKSTLIRQLFDARGKTQPESTETSLFL